MGFAEALVSHDRRCFIAVERAWVLTPCYMVASPTAAPRGFDNWRNRSTLPQQLQCLTCNDGSSARVYERQKAPCNCG